ncbi:MAG: HAD hydrolase family protein [Phycisphaerales bacterium]|nr:HAD hydrolase family protein [Phycisphaerales bacterium]
MQSDNRPFSLLERFRHIKAFAFDIDGVLTDNSLLAYSETTLVRSVNVKDGLAIVLAIQDQYPIFIISAGGSEELKMRFSRLGLSEVYVQSTNKLHDLKMLSEKYHLTLSQILYMGDDLPDKAAMEQVGVAACPADASLEIKQIANYISPYIGGKGCVRDVINKVRSLKVV